MPDKPPPGSSTYPTPWFKMFMVAMLVGIWASSLIHTWQLNRIMELLTKQVTP